MFFRDIYLCILAKETISESNVDQQPSEDTTKDIKNVRLF